MSKTPWPYALPEDERQVMKEVRKARKKRRVKLRCFIFPIIEAAYDREIRRLYDDDGKLVDLPECERPIGFEVVIFFADPTPTPGHLRTVCQVRTIEEALAAQRAVQRTLGQFVHKRDYKKLLKLYDKYDDAETDGA